MVSNLESFIQQYYNFPKQELDKIISNFQYQKIQKNDFLLRQDEVCKNFIFVNSGCLRLCYISEQIEVTVWFAYANSSALEISSFIRQTPSEYYIQAIEESEIFLLPVDGLNKLYETFPEMQIMMKRYWEDVVVSLINRYTSLQRDSSEKRYRDLLRAPNLLEKIPQKYLASYIGVSQPSLNRIRKSIKK